ncbi:MAG: hypothetical protein ACLTDV_08165 [Eubacterium sp.]
MLRYDRDSSDHKPKEIFDRIERYIFQTDKMIIKTDESIQSCLDEVEEMKKLIPQLTANDPHTLAKCLEAADTVLCSGNGIRAAQEKVVRVQRSDAIRIIVWNTRIWIMSTVYTG